MHIESNTINQTQIVPFGGALAAEIKGLNLKQPLADDVISVIRQALLDHCVILFREQTISETDQVRFTSYFGQPLEHVREQPEQPIKEIFTISNVEEKGKAIGALGNREIPFHADLSYMPNPGTLSVLYAIELPKTGGATQWVNCYAVYNALEGDLKDRIKGLRAVHRHPLESQNWPEPVDHPLVCTHPETGRQSLYINPVFTKYIVRPAKEENRLLLDKLLSLVVQPDFIWTHTWQEGDLIMWDNQSTIHRREAFPPTERRILKRTQVFNNESLRE